MNDGVYYVFVDVSGVLVDLDAPDPLLLDFADIEQIASLISLRNTGNV